MPKPVLSWYIQANLCITSDPNTSIYDANDVSRILAESFKTCPNHQGGVEGSGSEPVLAKMAVEESRDCQRDFNHTYQVQNNTLLDHLFMTSLF